MAEQKIILVIDEDGAISAKTFGFEGEACLEALDDILGEQPVASVKTTDDYHKPAQIKSTLINKQGAGK